MKLIMLLCFNINFKSFARMYFLCSDSLSCCLQRFRQAVGLFVSFSSKFRILVIFIPLSLHEEMKFLADFFCFTVINVCYNYLDALDSRNRLHNECDLPFSLLFVRMCLFHDVLPEFQHDIEPKASTLVILISKYLLHNFMNHSESIISLFTHNLRSLVPFHPVFFVLLRLASNFLSHDIEFVSISVIIIHTQAQYNYLDCSDSLDSSSPVITQYCNSFHLFCLFISIFHVLIPEYRHHSTSFRPLFVLYTLSTMCYYCLGGLDSCMKHSSNHHHPIFGLVRIRAIFAKIMISNHPHYCEASEHSNINMIYHACYNYLDHLDSQYWLIARSHLSNFDFSLCFRDFAEILRGCHHDFILLFSFQCSNIFTYVYYNLLDHLNSQHCFVSQTHLVKFRIFPSVKDFARIFHSDHHHFTHGLEFLCSFMLHHVYYNNYHHFDRQNWSRAPIHFSIFDNFLYSRVFTLFSQSVHNHISRLFSFQCSFILTYVSHNYFDHLDSQHWFISKIHLMVFDISPFIRDFTQICHGVYRHFISLLVFQCIIITNYVIRNYSHHFDSQHWSTHQTHFPNFVIQLCMRDFGQILSHTSPHFTLSSDYQYINTFNYVFHNYVNHLDSQHGHCSRILSMNIDKFFIIRDFTPVLQCDHLIFIRLLISEFYTTFSIISCNYLVHLDSLSGVVAQSLSYHFDTILCFRGFAHILRCEHHLFVCLFDFQCYYASQSQSFRFNDYLCASLWTTPTVIFLIITSIISQSVFFGISFIPGEYRVCVHRTDPVAGCEYRCWRDFHLRLTQ